MTITATASEISYAGDGVSTVFPIPFVFDTSADLKVIQTDSSGNPVVLSSGFSVGGGGGSTGTLTLLVALPSGSSLTILDNPDRTQTADYIANDDFSADSHERALDRGVRISKRIYQLLQKCVRVDDGDPAAGSGTLLGSVQARKGKYLFFNAITGAIEYAVALATTTLSQSIIGQLLYPQTSGEASAGVTPTFTIYAPSPRIDVRRYLTAWDDGSVQTLGLQRAINYAYARKGRLILPDGLNVASGALSLVMNGTRLTQGLAIEGAGPNSSIITQSGTPTEVFAFSAPTPTGNPVESQLVLENFTVRQAALAKTAHGITFNAIANWRMSNVHLQGFNRALNLQSALIGLIDQDCYFGDGTTGVFVSKYPGGICSTNLITIRDSRLNINSSWGLDYSGGTGLLLEGNDIERNGTTGVATSGGVVIRGALSPDALLANIRLHSNWFELNFGQQLLIEAPTGGCVAQYVIRGGHFFSSESNRCIKVLGGRSVRIEDLETGPGETWDITATHLFLSDAFVDVLTDTGVTYPHYEGSGTSTVFFHKGRPDSYTGTLTGCTTAPTATIFVVQDGDEILLTIGAAISAVSNTTSCTITGLPARYRPSAQRTILVCSTDNGVRATLIGSVETDGSIHLRPDTTFTAAGQKGAAAGPITPFRL